MTGASIQATVDRLIDLHGTDGLNKSAADWGTILRLGRDRPIGLVNLIRHSRTSDGARPSGYDEYRRQVNEVFRDVGGKSIATGDIGHSFGTTGHATYDRLVVSSYPTGWALADMWLDERYVRADETRRSGVEAATICLVVAPMSSKRVEPAAVDPTSDRELAGLVEKLIETHGEGGAAPTGADWRSIFRTAGEGPVTLVNTLGFRPDQSSGGDPDRSSDAYARYLSDASAAFRAVGGRMLGQGTIAANWGLQPERDLDHLVLTWYPSARALADMWLDPRFVGAHEHRRSSIATNTVHIAAA